MQEEGDKVVLLEPSAQSPPVDAGSTAGLPCRSWNHGRLATDVEAATDREGGESIPPSNLLLPEKPANIPCRHWLASDVQQRRSGRGMDLRSRPGWGTNGKPSSPQLRDG